MLLKAKRRIAVPPGLALAMILILLLVPTAAQPVHANTVVATVAVGNGPTCVAVNPTTNHIYTSNIGDNTASVIDGATNTVVATVAVNDGAIRVAVNPTTNRIYVTNYFSDNVSVIDGATNTVVATVAVGAEPYGVAVNPTTNRIYVANFASDNVSVIDGATNTVVATVAVGSAPICVAVNPTTNRIYVANASDNVSVIDGATNTVVATVAVGQNPEGITVNPTTNRIYVTNSADDTVSVIDGTTDTVVATVAVGDDPWGIAVNPATNRIYVANEGDDNVSVINGATNTVVATVAVGDGSTGVAVNPTTNRIYVANEGDDTVSVISDLLPSNVTDLTVTDVTTNSVTLSWTAPGNDGNVGTASQYDIRYSTSPITEANWASATQCAGEPAPQPAGTTQTFTVTNLVSGTYYFALKTADETPDWSGLSNVVTATVFTSQTGSRASPTPPRQSNPSNMGTFGLNIGPQAAAPNQPVTIATNVVNTGDEAGNLNVALKINGQLEQSRMVSVGPQGTQPVKFTVSKSEPGTYNVDIGGQKGSFTVLGHGGTAHAPLNAGVILIVIMAVLVLATAVVLALTFR